MDEIKKVEERKFCIYVSPEMGDRIKKFINQNKHMKIKGLVELVLDDFLNNIKAAIKWSKYGGIYLGEYFNYSGLLKLVSEIKFKELAKGINNVGETEHYLKSLMNLK